VLTDDEARAQLVAEAREHVLNFGWAEVAGTTLGLYRELAGLPIDAPPTPDRLAR
jgi:hypothetical protein